MEQVYNCKHILYPHGEHVTFYKRPVRSGKNEEDSPYPLPVEVKRKKETPAPFDRFSEKYIQDNMDNPRHKEIIKEKIRHSARTSASRAKNMVYRIARSNEWDWFITLTFRRTDIKANDYDVIVNKLKIFLNNLQSRKCPNLKYLIVPELHADKENYHFHGLLADCDGLSFVESGRYDTRRGFSVPIFNMPQWTYGFTTATRVTDSAKASSYITKYITKDTDKHLTGKHRYYKSDNCHICEADKLLLDEETFLEIYHDRIAYVKTVDAPYQKCTYYELNP